MEVSQCSPGAIKPRYRAGLRILFTDFDYKNDQNLKISAQFTPATIDHSVLQWEGNRRFAWVSLPKSTSSAATNREPVSVIRMKCTFTLKPGNLLL